MRNKVYFHVMHNDKKFAQKFAMENLVKNQVDDISFEEILDSPFWLYKLQKVMPDEEGERLRPPEEKAKMDIWMADIDKEIEEQEKEKERKRQELKMKQQHLVQIKKQQSKLRFYRTMIKICKMICFLPCSCYLYLFDSLFGSQNESISIVSRNRRKTAVPW